MPQKFPTVVQPTLYNIVGDAIDYVGIVCYIAMHAYIGHSWCCVHCHADVMYVYSVTILSLEGYNNSMIII